MHRLLLTGVGLVLVLYLLPVFYPAETDKTEPQTPSESVTAAATGGSDITVLVNGKAQEMPLETYVEGVTAAEIADDFPVEAIRAQAVAARTYAVYKQSRGRPAEHPDADVCDDYSHCKERIARQKRQDMCLPFLTNRKIPRKPGSFRGISLQ